MAQRQEVRNALLTTASVPRLSARAAGVATADAALRAKWRTQLAAARGRPGGEAALVAAVADRDRRALIEGDELTIVMRCVDCKVEKPTLGAYFTRSAMYAHESTTCNAGEEVFNNSSSRPCNVCFAALQAEAARKVREAKPPRVPVAPLVAVGRAPRVSKRKAQANALDNSIVAKWCAQLAAARLAGGEAVLLQNITAAGRRPVVEGDTLQLLLTCVKCKEEKPALTAYFKRNGDAQKLLSCVAGRESLNNYLGRPCHDCFNKMTSSQYHTVDGRVFHQMKPYRRLRATDTAQYGATPSGWFWETWRRQGGDFSVDASGIHTVTRAARCAITNKELVLSGHGTADAFSPSINNTNLTHTKAADHLAADCELICAELNVAQHDAIPCLKNAWRDIFTCAVEAEVQALTPEGRAQRDAATTAFITEMDTNWANRNDKKANGVTAMKMDRTAYEKQVKERDLFTVCCKAVSNYRREDIKAGRANDFTTAQHLYTILRANPRCAYSGVLLTITNGHKRFSLERRDNRVGHVQTNCVLICRVMNSVTGMSRRKFLELLLSQTMCVLPDTVRASVQSQLSALRDEVIEHV